MNQSIILGALMTLFAGMFWRKLDGIDKRMDKIEDRLEKLSEKIDELRTEMFHEFKEFYRTLGQHDGQIEALKREGK